jgi:hypothetical protein
MKVMDIPSIFFNTDIPGMLGLMGQIDKELDFFTPVMQQMTNYVPTQFLNQNPLPATLHAREENTRTSSTKKTQEFHPTFNQTDIYDF